MPTRFDNYPTEPRNGECRNAYIILCNAHDAASSFLDIFDDVRRKKRGAPTDEEQNLLRAMLIFATAGLDSMIKQLVEDSLSAVIDRVEGASNKFKLYIERRLIKGEELDRRFLAEIIADLKPRVRMLNELKTELGSASLQSTEQLFRAAAFFDIPSDAIGERRDRLDEIFNARNEIVHEMDVDFAQPRRNRRPRNRDPMTDYTNEVFRLTGRFLAEVDGKIGA